MMRKLVFILFAFLLATEVGFADQSKVDSLRTEISKADSDTSKVKILFKLCEYYFNSNLDTAMIIANDILELSQKIGDEKIISQAMNNTAKGYYIVGDYEISLQYLKRSLAIYHSINDKNGIARTLNNMGIIHKYLKNYHEALECYQKALEIQKEKNNQKEIGYLLNNIGSIYDHLNNYSESLDYYLRSLEIKKNLGNKRDMSSAYNNIGGIYYSQGNSAMISGDSIIGYKKYHEALDYHLKSLKIWEEIGDKKGIAGSFINIGQAKLGIRGFPDLEVLEACQESYEIFKEIKAWDGIRKSSKLLSDLYTKINNSDLAFKYFRESMAAKDSLINEEKIKEVGRLETRYEFEKAELERKEKARIEAEVLARRNSLHYYTIVFCIMGLGLTVMFVGFVNISPNQAGGIIFISLLILFEFLLVILDPYIEELTGGAPGYKLLINAGLAGLIFPLHQYFESRLKKRLIKVEKKKREAK
ncbi:tetratricopeptide repeat protein [bacterium AH-315-C07]|nr:tetratricopeptide repeat protein [bacterium AH-315-C07]